MRSFGPKKKGKAERVPFSFTVVRDDVEEAHEFQAVAATDTTGMAKVLHAVKADPASALPHMINMVARMCDNRDGTPDRWEPKPLPARDDDDAEERPERMFRSPDGDILPMSESAQFLEPEKGSSRRRWRALMDDDVIVDLDALTDLFEYLVSLGAGRPTRPRA